MKRNLIVLWPLVFAIGCASLWGSIVTITQVADAALKDAAELKVRGQLPVAIEGELVNAHQKYRQASGLAHSALVTYKAGGDKDQYLKALESLRSVAGELIDLIIPMLTADRAVELKKNLQKAREP